MREPDQDPTEAPPPRTYADLLGAAADVSAKAVDRLHDLRDRYPADLPPPVIAQIEWAHSDPSAERRVAVRLPADATRVSLRPAGGPDHEATILDRSAGGLSLRLGFLALPGAVLGVQFHGDAEWRPVEVRHTRPDEGAWVVGCVFVGGPPAV